MITLRLYFASLQLTLPDHNNIIVMLPRCAHSITAILLAPGLIEVTVFGGCPQYDSRQLDEELPKLAGTTIMTFGN